MHPLLTETATALKLPEATQKSLWQFCLEYQRWHATRRLTGAETLEGFIGDHLQNSLSALSSLRGERILDLGTGCGLPGLPLAIADQSRHFTLADRQNRRLKFVRYAASRLALDNLQVLQASADSIKSTFDTVITRALAPPALALPWTAPLVANGGRLILMQKNDRSPPADWPAPKIVRFAPESALGQSDRCLWLYDGHGPQAHDQLSRQCG